MTGAAGSARSRAPAWIEWLCLAGGLALVLRYRWLLDDAFVYFRYADNALFLGRGLVYNDGEYVEGYSSPLWMMVTLLLRLTRVDWWTLTAAVAAVAFVAFALLLVRLNRAMAPAGPVANVPLAYLPFCYGVACYFSSGLETPLVQITAVLFALFACNPSSRALQIAVGVMPVVRPELTLLIPIAVAWAARRDRRLPAALIASACACAGAWLAFRVWYYADLLPNTFYLKDEVSLRQGFVYLGQTVRTYRLHFVLAALAGLFAWFARRPRAGFDLRAGPRLVMLVAALAVTAYVVKIGGDFRHHRMLAFPFVLAVCAGAGLAEEWLARRRGRAGAWLAPVLAGVVAAVAFAGVPPQLDRHPVTRREGHREIDGVGDAAWDRHLPALAYSPRVRRLDRDLRAAYRQGGGRGHRGTLTTSLCVDGYLAFPYRIVNSLGLTDAILARTNARTDWAGHKYSLHAPAEDLVTMHAAGPLGPGEFRRRVEAGRAPAWVADNLESIETIERKIYNRGDLRENLVLAFTFPPRIRIPDRSEAERADPAVPGPAADR